MDQKVGEKPMWEEAKGWIGGKKALCGHMGRGWDTIQKWIKEDNFPARKIDGRWESDMALIATWRRDMILDKGPESCQGQTTTV